VDRPVRVIATGTRYALPTRLALVPGSSPVAATAPVDSVLSIDRWAPAQRKVTLAGWPDPRLLVLRENTNAGWRARIGAQVLRPVVVDGWQQGWIVPAGLSGAVTIDFAPDAAYRAGLIGGAVLLGAVGLAALPFAPGLAPPGSAPPGSAPIVCAPEGSRGRSRRRLLVLVGAAALVLAGGYVAVFFLVLGMAGMLVLAATAGEPLRRLLRGAPMVLFAVACLLSLRAADPHTAVGPQLAGVAALVTLWLQGTVRPSRAARPRPRWRSPTGPEATAGSGRGTGATTSRVPVGWTRRRRPSR
jgi:arabinofuranan 3-O-arabinosyltransferase